MQKLDITLEKVEGVENAHIAHFVGAFDGSMKDPLKELEAILEDVAQGTTLVFDFAKLDYLNSYAIGQLVAWQNHLLKNQGQIIIAALNKNVEDILSILGISNMFKIFPDIESAVSTLKS